MSAGNSIFRRYELLYGVTQAETYNVLMAVEAKLGMTAERKNKLLRAYVSNNFAHHVSNVLDSNSWVPSNTLWLGLRV